MKGMALDWKPIEPDRLELMPHLNYTQVSPRSEDEKVSRSSDAVL
jgi:hypothetical protein